ncbi:conserved hypothetical protein [Ricinus communis]|uniref:Reverse transcriptase n=1 Tax=Ricinus communis TaxID=3988 RepID=B9SFL7_RICCO|nr:conserved hypothetical protein [Ricinus communis]
MEASDDQVGVVKAVLNKFYEASGQRVSGLKTKVFFSSNVGLNKRRILASKLGYEMTSDLGKYLGMPILHGRINKNTYQGIVDKIGSKLAGWSNSCLSLAGRITLA